MKELLEEYSELQSKSKEINKRLKEISNSLLTKVKRVKIKEIEIGEMFWLDMGKPILKKLTGGEIYILCEYSNGRTRHFNKDVEVYKFVEESKN